VSTYDGNNKGRAIWLAAQNACLFYVPAPLIIFSHFAPRMKFDRRRSYRQSISENEYITQPERPDKRPVLFFLFSMCNHGPIHDRIAKSVPAMAAHGNFRFLGQGMAGYYRGTSSRFGRPDRGRRGHVVRLNGTILANSHPSKGELNCFENENGT
jgi:hypothetical protein